MYVNATTDAFPFRYQENSAFLKREGDDNGAALRRFLHKRTAPQESERLSLDLQVMQQNAGQTSQTVKQGYEDLGVCLFY